ncbi:MULTISPECIES: Ig-like domain-containing protein [unclassified Muribaculum]|uniref:Ig-like domain-containing protein n=1 Tax=unclassified Muribaculum TaxID=2622126 RepID=UPI001302DABB|nr:MULTISPECIES: Ig-like domain-containing protein [unclassified Muribaculum]
MKKYFSFPAAIAAACLMVLSCEGNGSDVVSVTISESDIQLKTGDSLRLEAQTIPSGAAVSWSSSDSEVATVDATGLVKAVSEGSATVIAEAGGVRDSCNVTVQPDRTLPSRIVPGDFFLADGSILSKDADAETVRNADVIGIVFCVDLRKIPEYDAGYLSDNGVIMARGFVMALKEASETSQMWYKDPYTGAYLRDETEIGFTDALVEGDSYGTFELSDADFSGFEKTCLVKEFRTDAYNAGYYPAMLAADEYNDYVPVPENATPWYLPSCGQFFEIIRNFADIRFDESNMLPINDDDFMWENITGIVEAINASMDKVSDNLKDPVNDTGVYWTSTTSSSTQARYVYLDNGWSVICMKANKNESYLVRPILTFGSF